MWCACACFIHYILLLFCLESVSLASSPLLCCYSFIHWICMFAGHFWIVLRRRIIDIVIIFYFVPAACKSDSRSILLWIYMYDTYIYYYHLLLYEYIYIECHTGLWFPFHIQIIAFFNSLLLWYYYCCSLSFLFNINICSTTILFMMIIIICAIIIYISSILYMKYKCIYWCICIIDEYCPRQHIIFQLNNYGWLCCIHLRA